MPYWILDRYLLRLFLKVLLVSFLSLTGLFVVIDAFNNLDEFISHAEKQGSLVSVLVEYYGARVLSFFDRTSALLSLISAIFVLTWLQRTNELTAILASGVPHRRVIRPILIAATCVSLLAAVNREVGIPQVRDKLMRNAQDWTGDSARKLSPKTDYRTNVVINGSTAFALEERIEKPDFRLHTPPAGFGRKLIAAEAFYQQPVDEQPGGYRLSKVSSPDDIDELTSAHLSDGSPFILTSHDTPWLKSGECFLVSEIDFQQLTKGNQVQQFSSFAELWAGLQNRSLDYGADVRVKLHSRLVQPLLDMTLVVLGLPLVISRGHRNMFVAAGYCLGLVIAFFMVVIACQTLGAGTLLSPAFAAWLPLLIFVPLAFTLTGPMRE
ncbi:LptF/LptG family permease [Lignipirellula cremea]|uniref:Putative permease YjgP/YjgQ family protein n=1 Tax=Lignipirellula cremea TaxID=2528010 RepID=A0A518DZI2_9BACT|nr:LptF/LptG family permease [Lignipirellula cremea]QDU97225.1 putative permease YjgP/YjgQ family protein [Lignipirellula cremea]